jgi:hypothetical protein
MFHVAPFPHLHHDGIRELLTQQFSIRIVVGFEQCHLLKLGLLQKFAENGLLLAAEPFAPLKDFKCEQLFINGKYVTVSVTPFPGVWSVNMKSQTIPTGDLKGLIALAVVQEHDKNSLKVSFSSAGTRDLAAGNLFASVPLVRNPSSEPSEPEGTAPNDTVSVVVEMTELP